MRPRPWPTDATASAMVCTVHARRLRRFVYAATAAARDDGHLPRRAACCRASPSSAASSIERPAPCARLGAVTWAASPSSTTHPVGEAQLNFGGPPPPASAPEAHPAAPGTGPITADKKRGGDSKNITKKCMMAVNGDVTGCLGKTPLHDGYATDEELGEEDAL
eukprot:TRINITY_DN1017_c0_g2_i2.p2 TRINITY_DN1017_c0_g2~~TRINITY_DN1017_c0_g2_i2.p2  ORF type:complete len:164 (+),score=13.88 TRINITY_DN1017_c0_g2_i2:568-1059(+)